MAGKGFVGMIVPSVDNSFFARLACDVEAALAKEGIGTFICNCANDAEKEKEYFRSLQEIGVQGIICVSGLKDLPDDLVKEGCPLVFVDRRPKSGRKIPWIANDDRKAMEEATDFLIQKGCKHILLAPGYAAEQQENLRVAGYREALEKNGISLGDEYILNRKGEKASEIETEEMVRSALRDGLAADGIITSSDRAAFGAMAALKSVGLYVPEDVKMISFDHSPYSANVMPSVTALDRNTGLLAQKAVQILCQQMQGQSVALENVVPVSMVLRDSTR